MTLTSVPRLISNTLWNLMSLNVTREEPSVMIETHATSRCIQSVLSIEMSSSRGNTSTLGLISRSLNPKSTMISLNQFTGMSIMSKGRTTMKKYLTNIVILRITTLNKRRLAICTQDDHKLSLSLQFMNLFILLSYQIDLKLCHTMT